MKIQTPFCNLVFPHDKLLGGTCYLISPYTKNPTEFFPLAARATKLLLQLGLDVFSPVIYGHSVVTMCEDTEKTCFWEKINSLFTHNCSAFAAIKCPGLLESEGCQNELMEVHTEKLGKAYFTIELETKTITQVETTEAFLKSLNYNI